MRRSLGQPIGVGESNGLLPIDGPHQPLLQKSTVYKSPRTAHPGAERLLPSRSFIRTDVLISAQRQNPGRPSAPPPAPPHAQASDASAAEVHPNRGARGRQSWGGSPHLLSGGLPSPGPRRCLWFAEMGILEEGAWGRDLIRTEWVGQGTRLEEPRPRRENLSC